MGESVVKKSRVRLDIALIVPPTDATPVNINGVQSGVPTTRTVLCEAVSSPECKTKTDYDIVGCTGTYHAYFLIDIEAYTESDFGRYQGTNYTHLKLHGLLSDETLDIASPCRIELSPDAELLAGLVSLDARKGVHDDNGFVIKADTACILSEEDSAGLGAGSIVEAGALTVQAKKTAKNGQNSSIQVTGDLEIASTEDLTSSTAIIKSGSNVNAGAIIIQMHHPKFRNMVSEHNVGKLPVIC